MDNTSSQIDDISLRLIKLTINPSSTRSVESRSRLKKKPYKKYHYEQDKMIENTSKRMKKYLYKKYKKDKQSYSNMTIKDNPTQILPIKFKPYLQFYCYSAPFEINNDSLMISPDPKEFEVENFDAQLNQLNYEDDD